MVLEDLERVRKSISNQMKVAKFKLRHKRLIKLSIEEVADYSILEKNDKEAVSVSPKYTNQDQCKLSYPVIDIKLYHLKNVFCNINSASFVTEDMKSIYIEEFPYINCEQADYKSGFLVKHNSQIAYVKNIKTNNTNRIGNAFFLGGNGSFNFYHWMIEIIPKLLYLNDEILSQYSIHTIVVDSKVKNSPNYKWLLDKCMAHLRNIDITYIDSDEVCFINNLFFLNTFNQTVFNSHTFNEQYCVSTIYNTKSLDNLRIRLIDSTSNAEAIDYSKVFILRDYKSVSHYNKRCYNQDEVFSFFENLGFVGIYPERLSVSEQINIFNKADFLIGPTGASWSHLIFAKERAMAISWLPKQYEFFDTYATLAYLNGVDMRFLQYKTLGDYSHGPYNIDVNDIASIYCDMINSK